MITLDERSGIAIQEIYPLIAGIGIGLLFHTPFQVITNSLPKHDLAQATGAFFLVRFMGTTTGLVRDSASFPLVGSLGLITNHSLLRVLSLIAIGWRGNQMVS